MAVAVHPASEFYTTAFGLYPSRMMFEPNFVIFPASTSLEAAACAVAARAMGYGLLADLIEERQLSPEAIAALLRRHSMAKDGASLAVIVLAASTARWLVQHDKWNGEAERLLALDAMHSDAAVMRAAARAANENKPKKR